MTVKIKFPSNGLIFLLFWGITFLLYLPAAKAGWVIDAAGWLYQIRHQGFWDYLNRTQSHIASLYQFTQLITYLFYKLWGANVWAWSFLYISLHSVNAWLLYTISAKIFNESEIKQGKQIALLGALLFVICPHVSEVIIWKACYHYLQGFLMILLSLYWVQKYQYLQKIKYAIYCTLLFVCSAFALEVFYLTPLFLLSLMSFYRFSLNYKKIIFTKSLIYFILPQLIMVLCYVFIFRYVYGGAKPHIYNMFTQDIIDYLSKPLKYIFHILFLGRYFSYPFRLNIYNSCNSVITIIGFYSLIIIGLVYFIFRFKRISIQKNALFLFCFWVGLTIVILLPLPFADNPLLVFYDRYTYFTVGFFYIAIVLLLSKVPNRVFAIIILSTYCFINIYFTIKLNTIWKHSSFIDNRLLHEFPKPGKRTVLLLNVPENLSGAPMIGSQPDGEFKGLRALFVDSTIKNPIYDVLSYNLTSLHDAVNIVVKNDSVLNVSFNQWGNWWWYAGHGASNYENREYKVRLIIDKNDYQLTLKHPHENYLLLYEIDGMWQEVKWIIEKKENIGIQLFDPEQYRQNLLIEGERFEYK